MTTEIDQTAGRSARLHQGASTITDHDSPPVETLVLRDAVLASLDEDKAIDVTEIDLVGKTTVADFMVVATGTSQRHVGAMADKLIERLVKHGYPKPLAEGLEECSWVLIDAGDVIIHLFRAETRAFYDIERLWSVAPPTRQLAAVTGG